MAVRRVSKYPIISGKNNVKMFPHQYMYTPINAVAAEISNDLGVTYNEIKDVITLWDFLGGTWEI